jgi:hypothetical protein
MSQTAQNLEQVIMTFAHIGDLSTDAEILKDAFSRVLEINSDIYLMQQASSLNAQDVSYLRNIIDYETRQMAVKVKESVMASV